MLPGELCLIYAHISLTHQMHDHVANACFIRQTYSVSAQMLDMPVHYKTQIQSPHDQAVQAIPVLGLYVYPDQ